MPELSDRARIRLRAEMKTRKLTQRDIAGLLKWSQSRVAKAISGRVSLKLDDLGALCFALGLSVTEVVRDQGMEFCAEMAPSELRLLHTIRGMTPQMREGLMHLVGITHVQGRRAMPEKQPKKRPA